MSNELISLCVGDLNKARMEEINGEGYKSGDIRTYKVAPLSSDPARDIEIHEYMKATRDANCMISMRTNIGVISGNSHSTSYQQSSNKVLHFPKAAEVEDLMLVKKVDISTPYPIYLIERYGLDNLGDDLCRTQQTGIYLDKSNGDFVVLFDEDFLDMLAPSDILSSLGEESRKFARLYHSTRKSGKNKSYIGIIAKSLNEITDKRNRDESNFYKIKEEVVDLYRNLFINAENSKKVICLSIKSDRADYRTFYSRSVGSILTELVEKQGLKLDIAYMVAAQRKSTFYPINEAGEIQLKAPFHFDRKHAHANKSPLNYDENHQYGAYSDQHEWSNTITVIIPYTEEDHKFIKSVVDRLTQLKSELIDFFKAGENQDGLEDSSFSYALECYKGNSSLLLIENK
ncbi:hypothetical protein QTV49_004664 [Vibrio vulnificus]|nr:hypothetical protein [Vibrio vulnificus]